MFTGLQIELEGIRAIAGSSDLPFGAVVEFRVVGFFKRNLAVDVDLPGHVHTGQLILTEAEHHLIETGGFHIEGVFHPLTDLLPLFTADRVQHDLGVMLRLGDGGFPVVDRVYGVVGGSRRRFRVEVDRGSGRLGLTGDVILVNGLILVGVDRDRLDRHRLTDGFQGDRVFAGFEVELKRVCIIAVGVDEFVIRPYVFDVGVGTQLVAVGVDLKSAVGVVVDPSLLHQQVTRFGEGNLVVYVEHPLDGVCLIGSGRVVDADRVQTGFRNVDLPRDLAVVLHHKALSALAVVVRFDRNGSGGGFSNIIRRVDRNGLRSSLRIRVLLLVRSVRDGRQGFADLLQSRLRIGVCGGGGIFSGGHYSRLCGTESHQKRQSKTSQLFACGFSHITFLLLVFGTLAKVRSRTGYSGSLDRVYAAVRPHLGNLIRASARDIAAASAYIIGRLPTPPSAETSHHRQGICIPPDESFRHSSDKPHPPFDCTTEVPGA